MQRLAVPLLLAALVAGCATPSARPLAPVAAAPVVPTYSTVGLVNVLGLTAAAVVARLGPPGLDVTEGAARKLQFLSAACVLDVYFYPPRSGGGPVATHLDARLPDGRDMDRASCVSALEQARQRR